MAHFLIFDSGVGGLSIWQAISEEFENASADYVMDLQGFPYGELTDAVLVQRCIACIEQVLHQSPADAIVVACNSASTLVLEPLRSRVSIPVIGVVPAIKPAAELSQRKHIGLLATPGTVKRTYTTTLINQFAPQCRVDKLGSSELVHMAEQKLRGNSVSMPVLEKLLQPISACDVIVLGCTHFPLLKQEIAQALNHAALLVDSGDAIARRARQLLLNKTNGGVQLNRYWFTENQALEIGIEIMQGQGFSHGHCIYIEEDYSESESF